MTVISAPFIEEGGKIRYPEIPNKYTKFMLSVVFHHYTSSEFFDISTKTKAGLTSLFREMEFQPYGNIFGDDYDNRSEEDLVSIFLVSIFPYLKKPRTYELDPIYAFGENGYKQTFDWFLKVVTRPPEKNYTLEFPGWEAIFISMLEKTKESIHIFDSSFEMPDAKSKIILHYQKLVIIQNINKKKMSNIGVWTL